jgi:predicted RNA-binding protein with PIN domain
MRQSFIIELARYRKKKGHQVYVVFDGGPDARPFKEDVHGISVVYSGFKESADDYIKHYISKQPGEVMVVTSDRQLRSWVQQEGKSTISSADFMKIVREQLRDTHQEINRSQAVKLTETINPELDTLLEQESRMGRKKEIERQERTPPAHKIPKQERVLQKKLKKL